MRHKDGTIRQGFRKPHAQFGQAEKEGIKQVQVPRGEGSKRERVSYFGLQGVCDDGKCLAGRHIGAEELLSLGDHGFKQVLIMVPPVECKGDEATQVSVRAVRGQERNGLAHRNEAPLKQATEGFRVRGRGG
jgi:hypothetical protein